MCIFSNLGINPHNMQFKKKSFLMLWTVNDLIISNWPFLSWYLFCALESVEWLRENIWNKKVCDLGFRVYIWEGALTIIHAPTTGGFGPIDVIFNCQGLIQPVDVFYCHRANWASCHYLYLPNGRYVFTCVKNNAPLIKASPMCRITDILWGRLAASRVDSKKVGPLTTKLVLSLIIFMKYGIVQFLLYE